MKTTLRKLKHHLDASLLPGIIVIKSAANTRNVLPYSNMLLVIIIWLIQQIHRAPKVY